LAGSTRFFAPKSKFMKIKEPLTPTQRKKEKKKASWLPAALFHWLT
jgi:hypothetical protein